MNQMGTEDFYIGTYSKKLGAMEANGEGIYLCGLNLDTGAFSRAACVATCDNPSYLAWGPDRSHIYATKEVLAADSPALLAYTRSGDGTLTALNQVPVDGELPCHLSVDPSGHYLASAQYLSGSATLFRVLADGSIGDCLDIIQHQGSGPDGRRQQGPHAHFAGFLKSPPALAVVDLGLDRVFAYPFDASTGKLERSNPEVGIITPGAGPRHIVATSGGNTIYVFSEMSACIFQFERDGKHWQEKAVTQVLDAPNGGGAALHLVGDGRYLYVSERSESRIFGFSIEAETGGLRATNSVASGGDGPRDFGVSKDGRFLVVANQHSNTLTSFFRDPKNGALRDTGHKIEIGSPVSVLF